jgi:hypothetical protein
MSFDQKSLTLSDYERHEAAFQLRIIEDYMNKVDIALSELKRFIIATLYDLAANNWICDRTPSELRWYRDMIEKWSKEFMERFDSAIKVIESIVEEAKKRQQQQG